MPVRHIVITGLLLVTILALDGMSGSPTTKQDQTGDVPVYRSIPDSLPIELPNTDAPPGFSKIQKAAETQGIRVTAEVKRDNSISAPINVSLTLKNGRDEDVFFNHLLDESDFYLCLVDRDGNAVSQTPAGKEWIGASLYEQTANPGMILHAGQTLTRAYDLKKFFKIDQIGPYRLEVVRTVNGTTSYPEAGRELEVEISSLVFGVSK